VSEVRQDSAPDAGSLWTPAMKPNHSTAKKPSETTLLHHLLLTLWVFSYAALVRGFLILRRFESDETARLK
jgi:hypothetical protein